MQTHQRTIITRLTRGPAPYKRLNHTPMQQLPEKRQMHSLTHHPNRLQWWSGGEERSLSVSQAEEPWAVSSPGGLCPALSYGSAGEWHSFTASLTGQDSCTLLSLNPAPPFHRRRGFYVSTILPLNAAYVSNAGVEKHSQCENQWRKPQPSIILFAVPHKSIRTGLHVLGYIPENTNAGIRH